MGVATNGSKLKVFISYSRDDLDFADQLAAGLELCGFDTTIDRHEISGGEAWQARLGGLIRDADTVAFVLSPSSATSKVCAWEVQEATNLAKRILPVIAKPIGATPAPEALQNLNYVFFYDEAKSPGSGFGTGLARLVAALNTDIDWVREHTRLLTRASEWDRGGKAANRLLSGNDIVEAKAWAARRPNNAPELTSLHLDYFRASEEEETNRASTERQRLEEMSAAQDERAKALKAAEDAVKRAAEAQAARARARWWITWGSAAFSVMLAGVAIVALLQYREANRKEAEALESKTVAEDNARIAKANRSEALVARSNTLAAAAQDRGEKGDETTRVLLALEALPDLGTNDDMPFVRRAKAQLDDGLLGLRELAVFDGEAQFTPDDKQVVFGIKTRSRLAEIATGQQIGSMLDAESTIFKLFSPNGRNIVLETGQGIELRRFETGAVVQKLSTDNILRWTRDRRYLYATTAQDIAVWDADTGNKTASFTLPDRAHLAELNSDASRAIVHLPRVEGDREVTAITLFDMGTGKEIAQLALTDNVQVVRYAFTDNGRHVTIQSGANVRVFNAVTGQERYVFADAPEMYFSRVVFSPDGGRFVSVSGDRALRLWDTDKEEPIATLAEHKQDFVNAVFSLDGKQLLTVSEDLAIVRDATTGAVRARLETEAVRMQPDDVIKATFSPDGRRVMLIAKSSRPGVFRADTGERLVVFETAGPVPDADFSPDGRFVVTSLANSSLSLYMIPTNDKGIGFNGSILIGGHFAAITASSFSRDGQLLLTTSHDGTSRVWSLRDLTPPDDVTTDADKADIDVVKRETAEKIASARQRVPRCLALHERIRYSVGPRPPSWCFEKRKHPYNDRQWSGWPDKVAPDANLGRDLGNAAGTAILDGDDRNALALSEMALLLAPDQIFVHINRGHALMYLGKAKEAREAYLSHRGKKVAELGKWEDVLVADFADLRRNGREETSLMREIEALFQQPQASQAAPTDAALAAPQPPASK